MPNRYVREDAIESEAVNRLGWQAEVFWRRLINRVDDFGRLTANRELLRASIFPLHLNKVSGAEIGKLLLECEHAGLLSTWKGEDGKEYLAMHKWEKGRAKESKYPEPPVAIRERLQTYVYKCAHPPAVVPDSDSAPDTASVPPPPSSASQVVTEPAVRPETTNHHDDALAGQDWQGMTQEQALALLGQHFPNADIWGEFQRFKTMRASQGQKPTWKPFIGWLRKASPVMDLGAKSPSKAASRRLPAVEDWQRFIAAEYPDAKDPGPPQDAPATLLREFHHWKDKQRTL